MHDNSMLEKRYKTAAHYPLSLGTEMACIFNNDAKLVVNLVGFEEDSFLLFRLPVITGIANYMQLSTPIVATFTQGAHKIVFKTTISLPLAKQRLAFCSYPMSYHLYEIRDEERFDCLIPAAIMLDKKYVGVLRDISASGCLLSFDAIHGTPLRNFQTDQRIALEIWTPQETLQIMGVIKRISRNFLRISLGITFGTLSKDDLRNLQDFLYNLRFSGVTHDESAPSHEE